MFSVCLGKDGGYFQMGGYDSQSHLESIQWLEMSKNGPYNIYINAMKMNNHIMKGSTFS